LSLGRPIKVVLYAAAIGLLLASYLGPLQEIQAERARAAELRADLTRLRSENADREREMAELKTPAGVERAARERYGMVYPGETVYLVPESDASEDKR
jgi:cell division protein FtsB